MALTQTADFRKTFLTLISSAFIFVAGLFWNSAVQSFIALLGLNETGSFIAQFTAAVIVTVVAVLAILAAQTLFERLDRAALQRAQRREKAKL